MAARATAEGRTRVVHVMAQPLPLASALVALAALGSCSCDDKPVADRPPVPAQADVSLFSDAFQFGCSPDREVGCEGVFPVRRGAGDFPTQLSVLWGGEESFRMRVELLERAKRSIRIQALIFRGDEAGLFLSEILKRKQKEGVDIRIIVDALSNLDVQTQWMYFDLKQHGVEVEGYEALYLNWLTADLSADDPLRPNKRFHDKMWIVDGEDIKSAAAVVGGLNIANEYFRVDSEPINRWRDQDVLLEGAILRDVTRAFDRNYDYLKGLKERLPALFNPDNSWKLTRAVVDRVGKLSLPTWTKKRIYQSIDETLKTPAKREPRKVVARFLQSRPRFSETYIAQAYLHLVRSANKRVVIVNAYFVPPREVIDALKDAARRGVHVQIVTNSPETNDIGPVATISRHLYGELLDVNREKQTQKHVDKGRGLEVWEWRGAELKEGTLHAKMALFDDDTALVGSFNLDPRSARLNSETAVVFEDRAVTAELYRNFEDDDLKKSRRIGWDEAQAWRSPEDLDKQFELLFALPMKGWL